MHIVVLVGRTEEIRVALLARQLRRTRIGTDVKSFGLESRCTYGQQHVREHNARHEVDFVTFDQTVCRLTAYVGTGLVICHDDFNIFATKFTARQFHG